MVHNIEERKQERIELLDSVKVLKLVNDPKQDGVEFINISRDAKTDLGKMLHPNFIKPFNTIFGKTISVRMFLNAATLKDFDLSLIYKSRLTKEDIARIPDTIVTVTNYWSLLAYALCARISADKELQKLIKQNNLPYITLAKPVSNNFFGMSVTLNRIRTDSVRFIAILELIAIMLKEDRFTAAEIEQFCLDLRTDKTKSILDGIACLDKLNVVNN